MAGSPGVLAEGVTCRAYGAKTQRTHCATWHAKGKGWVVCNSLSEVVLLGAANMNAFGLTLKQSGNSKPWSLFMATSINRSIYPSKTDIAAAASGPHTCITCTHWSRGKD